MFPTKAAFWQSGALPLSYGAIYPLHNNSQCVYCKVLCLAERVGLEPTSQFPDQRFSRPSDYQLSHLSNMVAGVGVEPTITRLWDLYEFRFTLPQYSTPGRSRTCKILSLNQARMPIPSPGQFKIVSQEGYQSSSRNNLVHSSSVYWLWMRLGSRTTLI